MSTSSEIPFPADWPGLDDDDWRPRTREDCAKVPRPCPYVGCRYNMIMSPVSLPKNAKSPPRPIKPTLYVVVDDTDNPLDIDPRWSCALDIAERNPQGVSQREISRHMRCTRQNIDLIENTALSRIEEMEIMLEILLRRDGVL